MRDYYRILNKYCSVPARMQPINELLSVSLMVLITVYLFFSPVGDLEARQTITLRWGDLAGLNLQTGKLNPKMKASVNKKVRIAGFMIPLEDDYDDKISEFLLVPYPLACIHVPAPPANQLIHVKMKNNRKTNFYWYEPIWMTGLLKLQKYESDLAETNYTMVGLNAGPYEGDYNY